MDRITFFQSVDHNKEYDSAITTLFDQLSALYNIFGKCDDVHVENITEPNKVQFNITSTNPDSINYVYECFSNYKYSVGNIIEIYGRYFEIDVYLQGDKNLFVLFISKDQFPMNVI